MKRRHPAPALLVGIVLATLATAPHQRAQAASPEAVSADAGHDRPRLAGYRQLPLSFESNRGQTAAQVRFLSHGSGYTLFLTPTEAVLALRKSATQKSGSHSVVRMKLLGANPAPGVSGLGRLAGTSNYFIGSDPGRWRRNIPSFAQVRYKAVYPGVDLVYHGNQRQLEFDFQLAPGVDPRVIRLAFHGIGSLRVDSDGSLLLHSGDPEIRVRRPRAYQQVNGVVRPVAVRYAVTSRREVGFAFGKYDPGNSLIIDPVLAYSSFLGGKGSDGANAIAVDSTGIYVAGSTASSNFPVSPGAYQTRRSGNSTDAFVTKLNPSGTALLYSTYLGGMGYDQVGGLAIDAAGNAYVAGRTASSDFPRTANASQSAAGGGLDAFVTKLNAAGSGLVYSSYLGGSGQDIALGVAMDGAGYAYIAGVTNSTNLPTKAAFDTTCGTDGQCNMKIVSRRGKVVSAVVYDDAFVAAFNTNAGTASDSLVFATYFGGKGTDAGVKVTLDAGGNAYITGYTDSPPATPTSDGFPVLGAYQSTLNGRQNAFVAAFSSAGSLKYSSYLGGSGIDTGFDISADSSGNVYLAGSTDCAAFPTTSDALYSAGDVFFTKLAPAGGPAGLLYSTCLPAGNTGGNVSLAVVDDTSPTSAGRNVYLTGQTKCDSSVDSECRRLLWTNNTIQLSLNSAADAYVIHLRMPNSGSPYVGYATYLGGRGYEQGLGAAADSTGVYITGFTGSSDFPTAGAYQITNKGAEDAFVVYIKN